MFLKHQNSYIKSNGYIKVGSQIIPSISSFVKTNGSEMSWFADIIEEYTTNDNAQMMMIVRHSERESSGDRQLTSNGVEYAKRAGTMLSSITNLTTNNCVFYSTNVTGNRTKDTASNFSLGMFGSQQYVDDTKEDKFKIDYPIGSSGWADCANYSNNPDNEESQANVSKQIINGCYSLLKNKKFGLFVSHDYNTLPLVGWASNHTITFDFQGNEQHNEWLCYIAGILVVIIDGVATMKPIYSIDSYYKDGQFTTITSGDNGYKGVMRDKDNYGYGNVLHTNY